MGHVGHAYSVVVPVAVVVLAAGAHVVVGVVVVHAAVSVRVTVMLYAVATEGHTAAAGVSRDMAPAAAVSAGGMSAKGSASCRRGTSEGMGDVRLTAESLAAYGAARAVDTSCRTSGGTKRAIVRC